MMTGPERYVACAIASLTLESIDKAADDPTRSSAAFSRPFSGARIDAVAELSKYPDLEDRRIVESLCAKGLAEKMQVLRYQWGTHDRVRLTPKGWMEVFRA